MKNITEDNLVVSLISRMKFLETSYLDIHLLCSKLFVLKPTDANFLSKFTQMKENFQIFPRPEFTQEDNKEILAKILSNIKTELNNSIQDTTLLDNILEIFDRSCNELFDYTIGKANKKLSSQRPTYTKVEMLVKNTEKKIAAFQREARKLSSERKAEFRDVTPVRSSVNRSISPADKKSYLLHQENIELKDFVKKLQTERDVLKA